LTKVGQHSEPFGNYDMTSGDVYLGRLYVLPTTEPELISAGIDKQWFITHERGDFVVSGYINKNGEWSLSAHQSLEPALSYSSQSAVFSLVFSESYTLQMQQQRLSQSELQENELSLVEALKHNAALPIFSSVGDESSSDKDDGGGGDKQGITSNESGFLFSLPGVRELMNGSLVLEDADAVRSLEIEEDESNVEVEKIAQWHEAEPEDRAKAVELSNELMREQAQERLVMQVIEAHRQLTLRSLLEQYEQELKNPSWMLVVDQEQHLFRLFSRTDGHTVLEATLSGEVLKPLSLEDALQLEENFQLSILNVRPCRFDERDNLVEIEESVSTRQLPVEKQDKPEVKEDKQKKDWSCNGG
jgi:hypothetical protein